MSRSGRYYAWAIALFYAGLLALTTFQGVADTAISIVTLALTTISWAGGLVACAAARDLDVEERTLGLERMAAARGVPRYFREAARLLSTMAVITLAVLLPSLFVALVALALAPTFRAAAVLTLLVLGVIFYAAFFGATLGAIARWSSSLSRRHARTVFTLVVFGPLVVHAEFGKMASLPHAFAWMIARIGELGAS
jgi:ABC-type transport system involved in multi-copper enzyme maturation permease subunit